MTNMEDLIFVVLYKQGNLINGQRVRFQSKMMVMRVRWKMIST